MGDQSVWKWLSFFKSSPCTEWWIFVTLFLWSLAAVFKTVNICGVGKVREAKGRIGMCIYWYLLTDDWKWFLVRSSHNPHQPDPIFIISMPSCKYHNHPPPTPSPPPTCSKEFGSWKPVRKEAQHWAAELQQKVLQEASSDYPLLKRSWNQNPMPFIPRFTLYLLEYILNLHVVLHTVRSEIPRPHGFLFHRTFQSSRELFQFHNLLRIFLHYFW